MTDAATAALDLDSKTEPTLEENEKFWKGPNESGYYNVYGDQFNNAAEILITKYKIPVLKKIGWKFAYNGFTYGCNKYKIDPSKYKIPPKKKWEKTLYKVKRQFSAAKKVEEIKKEKTSEQIEQELVNEIIDTISQQTGKIDMYGLIRVIIMVLVQILPGRVGESK